MITQENIPYTADEIKAMVKTCEKYNKALEKAKGLLEGMKEGNYNALEDDIIDIFPELKESEDEKIRKTLIEHIKGIKSWNYFLGISKEQMITWLEKQGQKEVTWNKEDEENMNNVLYILHQLKDTSSYEEDNVAENTINWFNSLKDRLCSNNEYDKDMLGAIEYCKKNNRPLEKEHLAWLEKQGKQNPVEWSEEDEKMIQRLKSCVYAADITSEGRKELISWLEKQGKAYRINNTPNCGISVNIYNEKLKDERMKEQLSEYLHDNMHYKDAQEITSWLEKLIEKQKD